MNKRLLILPFISALLWAGEVEPKVMRANDNNQEQYYENSTERETTEDRVISSTAEASAQITITVTLQVSSDLTSKRDYSMATLSFLDQNRLQLTEEIAKGDGEHLKTLLTLLEIDQSEKNLKNIQNNFSHLIHLNHDDFLKKLESLT